MMLRTILKRVKSANNKGRYLKESTLSIPIDAKVMQQVGVDLCNVPEVNSYKHLIVLIDYFSKWSKAKAVKDKSAPTVARFLYEVMCRHGCFKTQINDQGKEFVNKVSDALLELTVADQRVTSAYHPQPNGLCERQNRTIKDSLVNVLEKNPKKWPNVIEGVLFAHRLSAHYSTKFSPFFLLCNRHPTLPIDVKYNLVKDSNDTADDDPYGFKTFRAVLNSSSKMRDAAHNKASQNIKKAQKKQQKDYNKRHNTPTSTLPIRSKVLLQNLKRLDRKGGKFTFKWIGPYIIQSISKTGLCALSNQKGVTLKKNYNVSLLKPFYSNERPNTDVDEDPEPEPEAVKIHEDSEPKASRNFFDQLPVEIVNMILELATVNQHVITFNAVHNTCSRFRSIIKEKQNDILPRVYLAFYDNVLERLPRRGNKIKVCVNKLSRHSGPNSVAIDDVSKTTGNKNWRSAWLLIEKRKYSWFVH